MDHLTIANALHDQGWITYPQFLSETETAGLAEHVRQLNHQGQLKPATIGHLHTQQHNESIRGDAIIWLNQEDNGLVKTVEQRLDDLRATLNQELMLGLFEFEGHFAAYPPNSGYKKHLDQFKDSDARRVTIVLYLNPPDWSDNDGGALRLYLDGQNDAPYIDIPPTGGTLIVFLSDRFYHEVRATQRERLSLTGWFRVRE